MNIVIDMNLSPDWVDIFKQQGWHAVHWADVGDIKATDKVIMEWAKEREVIYCIYPRFGLWGHF